MKAARCSGALLLLEPGSEGLILHAMQGGKLRAAQPTGSKGLNEGCLLLRRIAETSAPVELHKGIVRSIHRTQPYQRYAMQ